MHIAFLSALLDPIVIGVAIGSVFLARSAMQMRLATMSVAAALSLTELIGGADESAWPGAVGAAMGGLVLAESARFILVPIVALFVALWLRALMWLRSE
jgi:hypothetical protein